MTKCVHPRIALRLMTEFVNTACDLTYGRKEMDSVLHLYAAEEAEKDPTIQVCTKECVIRKGDDFGTYLVGATDTIYITYNYDSFDDVGTMALEDFLSHRFPLALNFHLIVFTLLHELGHNETEHLLVDYDRQKEIDTLISNASNPFDIMENYFTMQDELLATTWAIEWLQDEKHQQIAREFEKKFLACFE